MNPVEETIKEAIIKLDYPTLAELWWEVIEKMTYMQFLHHIDKLVSESKILYDGKCVWVYNPGLMEKIVKEGGKLR